MLEKNSKFPRIIIFMLLPIALIMLVGMFFSATLVGSVYLVALLVTVVFLILDKHYSESLTNYKLSYLFLELINLIAVAAIIYYEWREHSTFLNVLLVILVCIELTLMILDVMRMNNCHISKKESVLVTLSKIGSMVCILTYFYKVSVLWFAIFAVMFEVANLVLKTYFNGVVFVNEKPSVEEKKGIEDIIRSFEDEGDLD